MITIQCPIKQDFIIELLDHKCYDGITFTHVSKKGVNLVFDCDSDDLETAIKVVKKTIKSTEIGSVLYFTVK